MDLPTTPMYVKHQHQQQQQQVIDIKAGNILRRENSRKDNLYYGCPIGIVLVLIILIKCSIISIWVIREYDTFDFRCTAWDSDTSSLLFRTKRWTMFGETDPRNFAPNSKISRPHEQVINDRINRKPLYGSMKLNDSNVESPKIDPKLDFGPLPPTFRRREQKNNNNRIEEEENDQQDEDDLPLSTMVTLTNTQLIPLKGDGIVKMKTIRNRVEKVGSDEEQFMEIDIADSPRIYVSKIKSRHGGEENQEQPTDFDILKDVKKKKGKGLKKLKKQKMLEEEARRNGTIIPPLKEKSKKHKKKKHRHNNLTIEVSLTETTKNPRHLVSGASLSTVTPRPVHKSSWIDGVVDPDDPKFSNQGEIRGYQMQKATRKPTTTTSSPTIDSDEMTIRLSDETKKMWQMDEIKFTTFMAPKTTQVTMINDKEQEKEKESVDVMEVIPISIVRETSYQPTTQATTLMTIRQQPPIYMGSPWVSSSTISPIYDEVNDADTEIISAKDYTNYPKTWQSANPSPYFTSSPSPITTTTTTERPYDPQHFENELQKLKLSTMCMTRMAFDVWCLFMLFSAVPFMTGICVPRWSLFVLHIVFDFLFLVVGFVSSLTIAIMSTIMYFLIDEMSSDSLFEFLCVAFVIDIILIIYSLLIVISYRCCSRLVENFIKNTANTTHSTYSSLPEQV